MEIITRSVVTCPNCGTRTEAEMPAEACLVFFECESCHVVLRPKSGDCCVFCSYANVKCPPVQLRQDCGGEC
ncbi:MAG TPA: GDCCVxC domain-containing (seleno)protein [Nitrospira sp.]|nr:GDCCVxC domain-containing (seleno)protein [Nitrospira sp.]